MRNITLLPCVNLQIDQEIMWNHLSHFTDFVRSGTTPLHELTSSVKPDLDLVPKSDPLPSQKYRLDCMPWGISTVPTDLANVEVV